MATLEQYQDKTALAERFAVKMAIVIAAVVVLGFSMHLAMGRSTFASPLRVHLHAVVEFPAPPAGGLITGR